MSKIRQRYDEEFRKNAVKLSYATTKTIKEFCEDLGIHPSLLYRWRKIYTENGDKTKVAEQQDKLRQMQLELAELKIENEMLKNRDLLCEKSKVKCEFAIIPSIPLQSGPLVSKCQLVPVTTGWSIKKNGIRRNRNMPKSLKEFFKKAKRPMVLLHLRIP